MASHAALSGEIQTISPSVLEKLAQFDTCTISNAIEQFNVKLRNEGFMNSSVRCQYPGLAPKAGYAVTGRMRSSSTPISGRCYYEAMEWWSYLVTVPAPRFVVMKDSDHVPGIGAFIGEIHANIAAALGCVAYVTNGSIRDVPGVGRTGLQVFASHVSVSHAYAHVVDFGEPVEVGGLLVKPGDLLHGDLHGVQLIPRSIANELPQAAEAIIAYERELIQFCRSPEFSLEGLTRRIEGRDKSC